MTTAEASWPKTAEPRGRRHAFPKGLGDVPVVLELAAGEDDRYVATLWHGDRRVDLGLDRILRLHESLVAQLTRDARSA